MMFPQVMVELAFTPPSHNLKKHCECDRSSQNSSLYAPLNVAEWESGDAWVNPPDNRGRNPLDEPPYLLNIPSANTTFLYLFQP